MRTGDGITQAGKRLTLVAGRHLRAQLRRVEQVLGDRGDRLRLTALPLGSHGFVSHKKHEAHDQANSSKDEPEWAACDETNQSSAGQYHQSEQPRF